MKQRLTRLSERYLAALRIYLKLGPAGDIATALKLGAAGGRPRVGDAGPSPHP